MNEAVRRFQRIQQTSQFGAAIEITLLVVLQGYGRECFYRSPV